MSVYVCGDIHGQYNLFKAILDHVGFSKEDHLYIIGDLIDRGPDSIKLMQYAMAHDNIECLLGNHELLMYTHYRFPDMRNWWIGEGNGGEATKKEYDTLSEAEQGEILDYIQDMFLQKQVVIGTEKFLLSHSDFLPDKGTVQWKDFDYNTVFNVVWNSPWRFWEYVSQEKYRDDNRIHIIGHVPVIFISENPDKEKAFIDKENGIINIDMGCARIEIDGDSEDGKALCLLNLSAYAEGNKDEAFTYVYWKTDTEVGFR